MAENLDIKINVDANTGIASLDRLNKSIDKVSNNFSSMKGALLGLGLAALGASALRMADDLQDLSNAVGMSVASLVEFKTALATSGGEADKMPAAINTFVRSLDEARQGSIKAQNSFIGMGVSLSDLSKMGDRDLMIKTLEGLAEIDDAGRRATLMMDKFGKSFRTVDPGELANKLRSAAGSGDAFASSIARAAQLSDKMTEAQGNLSLALLLAFEPIINKINAFNAAMEQSNQTAMGLVNIIKVLGVVLAASFALTAGLKIVAIIGQIGRGLVALKSLMAANTAAVGSMVAATGRVMTAFRGMVALVAVLGTSIYAASQLFDNLGDIATNALARMIEGVGRLTGELLNLPTDAIAAAMNAAFGTKIKAWGFGTGLINLSDQAQKAREEAEKTAAYVKKIGGGRGVINPELVTPSADGGTPVDTKARENAVQALEKMTSEYAKQQVYLQKAIGLEAEMVGMDEDQKTRMMAQEDLARAYLTLQDQLIERKQTLTAEEQYLLPIIDAQLAKAKLLYAEQSAGLDRVLTKQQSVKMIEAARLQDQQNMVKAIEDQIARQTQLGELMQSANDKLVDVKFAGVQAGKSPLQQQFDQIQEDARKAALEAGRAFAAGFDGMELTTAQSKELADGLEQIAQQYKAIATEQTKQLEASRSFEAGWKKAFESYADDATNAAKRAGDLFNAVTSSMNSAIDNFVDNGKFSFSDFASSLIKDMIKIELKASAMNLMKMMGGAGGGGGGGGGILSGIASLFGFADGGDPPVGKASIVGEKGPELFVPKKAGTIIPNGASVAAMGGGGQQISNTYITNNISAIDSKSVAQLFTENRRLLLGTVKAAEKELPYRGR